MIHSLVVFDRKAGRVTMMKVFDDSRTALRARFEYERHAEINSDIEVVVLVAESEETLRKTHSRYFDNMTEMLDKRLAHRTLPSAPSRPRSRLAFFRSRTA